MPCMSRASIRLIERTPLQGGTSLAVHESQSRMWENLVGRSLPFWEHFYPDIQEGLCQPSWRASA